MSSKVEIAKIHKITELVDYTSGATVSKIIAKNGNGSTTLFSFDKDQSLSEHKAPFDVTLIVLDGKCQVCIDEKEYNLETGDLIIMPADITHSLFATEAFKMLLIMIKAK